MRLQGNNTHLRVARREGYEKVDIKIVSVDAVRSALGAMIAGKLNVTVECNPLLGPQFFETALKLANGKPVEKWVKSKEGIYRQETARDDLAGRQY